MPVGDSHILCGRVLVEGSCHKELMKPHCILGPQNNDLKRQFLLERLLDAVKQVRRKLSFDFEVRKQCQAIHVQVISALSCA